MTSKTPSALDLPRDEVKSYFLAVGGLGPSKKGVEPSVVQHENEAQRLARVRRVGVSKNKPLSPVSP